MDLWVRTCMSMCTSSGHHHTGMCVGQVAYAEEIPGRKAQQGVQEINFADREHLDTSRRGS